jgi:nucleoside-diphosphate-sugar epimerase
LHGQINILQNYQNEKQMQTILGSGGAIGIELAKAIKNYTTDIRLVSRTPKKINDFDKLFAADLNDRQQVLKAVENSTVCYLTIGYEYDTKLWQEKWPLLIKNVVDACAQHRCKLVFFDNVYAIGGDNVKHMTEASPISPTSKKGTVRAYVDRYILENAEKGKLQAIIARAPDFFGPVKEKSILMNLIYDNMAKGEKVTVVLRRQNDSLHGLYTRPCKRYSHPRQYAGCI